MMNSAPITPLAAMRQAGMRKYPIVDLTHEEELPITTRNRQVCDTQAICRLFAGAGLLRNGLTGLNVLNNLNLRRAAQ